MERQNRNIKILKDKSGASLIFVLAIMLLLIIIGISVLTAASANVGFELKQKEYNQVIILDNSIHKNILYSLQHDTSEENLLSAQLVMAIYKANDSALTQSYSPDGLADMQLEVNFDTGVDLEDSDINLESITLSFPEQNVIITPHIPAIYEDEYDENGNVSDEIVHHREPKTATVNATMIITVEINARGKIITSRAFYEYTGGELSDDSKGIYVNDENNKTYDMSFAIDENGEFISGKWRLIKHENVESKY